MDEEKKKPRKRCPDGMKEFLVYCYDEDLAVLNKVPRSLGYLKRGGLIRDILHDWVEDWRKKQKRRQAIVKGHATRRRVKREAS